jgi:hypothetical protein
MGLKGLAGSHALLDDIGPGSRSVEKPLFISADRLDGEVLDPSDEAVPVGEDEFGDDIEGSFLPFA